MLRFTCSRRALAGGSAQILNSTDLAFHFPRMHVPTHLVDAGLPELKECKTLYGAGVKENAGKCYQLLQRASEVFTNIPDWQKNEQLSNVVRSIVASKTKLAMEARGPNGTLPKMHTHRVCMREAAAALRCENWSKSDVNQLDIGCHLVARYLESFAILNPRRVPGSLDPDRLIKQDEKHELTLVMDKLDELLKLSKLAAETHGAEHPSLRWLPVKVTLLKAIGTIPLTGNLLSTQELIQEAALIVESWGKKRSVLSDLTQDPTLGLFLLMKAEINARIFNWSSSKEVVDQQVLMDYQMACQFYSDRFDSTTQHDGVMNMSCKSRSANQSDAEDLVLRDYYSTCLLSYGNFLLSCPRTNAKETIFPRGESFTRNAIITVATGSDLIYDDVRRPSPFPVGESRKQSQQAFDRALKLNRLLLPDAKHNEKAAWILLSMACGFGDLRDYLYATGLMSNASNIFREIYGDTSEEMLFLLRLEERMLNGMGSAKEAETRQHKIAAILAEREGYAV